MASPVHSKTMGYLCKSDGVRGRINKFSHMIIGLCEKRGLTQVNAPIDTHKELTQKVREKSFHRHNVNLKQLTTVVKK